MTPSPSRPTLTNLQALRGLACLLVVAYHIGGWEKLLWVKVPLLSFVRWFGYAGVDIFFVLSGFIITWSHRSHLGRRAELPRYLFRRAWRIYPPLWAAQVFAAVSASLVVHQTVFEPQWVREWVHWLTLVPMAEGNRFLAVAWSLSYEVLFYLVFGLLFVLPRRWAGGVLGGWAAAVLGVGVFGSEPTDPVWRMTVSPFVLEFLGGTAIAAAVTRGHVGRPWVLMLASFAWVVAGLLLFAGPAADDLSARNWHRVAVFGPASVGWVWALVAGDLTGRLQLPTWLRPFGDASYSIYLMHLPCGLVAFYLTWGIGHSFWPHLVWVVLLSSAGIGGGWTLHAFVEQPLLRLVNRKKTHDKQPP